MSDATDYPFTQSYIESLAVDYDEIFERFNTLEVEPEPDTVLRGLISLCPPPATILDVGSGQGQCALFFAAKGYQVTACDISPAGLDCLTAEARQRGLQIETHFHDACRELWADFDVLINSYSLYQLTPDDAVKVMGNMQRHTKLGGLNAITTMICHGSDRECRTYFHVGKAEEILSHYGSDWEVVTLVQGYRKSVDCDVLTVILRRIQ